MTMPVSHKPDDIPPFSSLQMMAVEEIAKELRDDAETPAQTDTDPPEATDLSFVVEFLTEAAKSLVLLVLLYYFTANAVIPHVAHALNDQTATPTPTQTTTTTSIGTR